MKKLLLGLLATATIAGASTGIASCGKEAPKKAEPTTKEGDKSGVKGSSTTSEVVPGTGQPSSVKPEFSAIPGTTQPNRTAHTKDHNVLNKKGAPVQVELPKGNKSTKEVAAPSAREKGLVLTKEGTGYSFNVKSVAAYSHKISLSETVHIFMIDESIVKSQNAKEIQNAKISLLKMAGMSTSLVSEIELSAKVIKLYNVIMRGIYVHHIPQFMPNKGVSILREELSARRIVAHEMEVISKAASSLGEVMTSQEDKNQELISRLEAIRATMTHELRTSQSYIDNASSLSTFMSDKFAEHFAESQNSSTNPVPPFQPSQQQPVTAEMNKQMAFMLIDKEHPNEWGSFMKRAIEGFDKETMSGSMTEIMKKAFEKAMELVQIDRNTNK